VSLDLLSLNKLKYSYVNMREVVDHYFPPTNTLLSGGGEEVRANPYLMFWPYLLHNCKPEICWAIADNDLQYTDFSYWREPVLDIDDFSDSESGESEDGEETEENRASEDEGDDGDEDEDEDANDELGDSYISRGSIDEYEDANGLEESILSESIEGDEMTSSMLEAEEVSVPLGFVSKPWEISVHS